MESNKTSKSLIGAGVLTAIASSLCCITPVLALVAGSSGLASTFSWLEPARPYLIGFTALILGYVWWEKLKPRKILTEKDDCDCEVEDKKTSFMQTKTFLGVITIFAIVMTAFPYYSGVFFPDNAKEVVIVNENNIQELNVTIEGMTCDACQQHVDHSVNELSGIIEVNTSYAKGNTIVKFDNTITSIKEIEEAINSTGYTVVKTDLE